MTEVSALLWDLRAQSEEQHRAIADAQRLADAFRQRPTDRAALARGVLSDLDTVVRSSRAIGDAASDCARLVRAFAGVDDDAPAIT